MNRTIHPASSLRGELTVPGDKSISHRAVMFGAISGGDTRISNFLMSADCLSTISCFKKLGIEIDTDPSDGTVTVHGRGPEGLREPSATLDAGNSGTTTRLMSGILSGQKFESCLDGDSSLRKRPMGRIITPLRMMGADISSADGGGCVPLRIAPSPLHGIDYISPASSAQVKSCILLAGLYASSPTSVTESTMSRDHTERMLRGFGADVSCTKTESGYRACIMPHPRLQGTDIQVPGDISSAAYFIAAALITPGSEILIRNVGVNPTRSGILEAFRLMGGDIQLMNCRTVGGEEAADILVRSSSLHSVTIGGSLIPSLIDELPVLACAAAYAGGTTVIKDAGELRVKESDRIETTAAALSAMGADVRTKPDGMIIRGGCAIHGADADSCMDHRIAMSIAVCALAAHGETTIKDADCVGISYPSFYSDLEKLSV